MRVILLIVIVILAILTGCSGTICTTEQLNYKPPDMPRKPFNYGDSSRSVEPDDYEVYRIGIDRYVTYTYKCIDTGEGGQYLKYTYKFAAIDWCRKQSTWSAEPHYRYGWILTNTYESKGICN